MSFGTDKFDNVLGKFVSSPFHSSRFAHTCFPNPDNRALVRIRRQEKAPMPTQQTESDLNDLYSYSQGHCLLCFQHAPFLFTHTQTHKSMLFQSMMIKSLFQNQSTISLDRVCASFAFSCIFARTRFAQPSEHLRCRRLFFS